MKRTRITPLNIASALLLTALLWQLFTAEQQFVGIGWFLLFLLVLMVADQFFRLLLRSMKRVWFAESGFIAVVALIIWIIRTW